jgi:hypothetical protein
MPVFPGIERPDQLPKLGERESPTLDFKGKLDRLENGKVDSFELAKDVAAMASVYGGTLLVGACEEGRGGKLATYKPLSASDSTEAIDAYQKATRDRCRPAPLLSPRAIPFDAGSIVAINVMPVIEGPVAVRIRSDGSDGYGGDAYVFPVRLSTHAIMFTPERLPMLMNPDVRRMAILLQSIPKDAAKVRLWMLVETPRARLAPQLPGSGPPTAYRSEEVTELDVSPERNVLICKRDGGRNTIWVPLDDVVSVSPERDDQWGVRVAGTLVAADSQFDSFTYRPGRRK